MMSKEKKQVYIQEMKTTFDKSEAVIVAHYQGLTVSQLDELRSKMREHGIKFKITKSVLINKNKLFVNFKVIPSMDGSHSIK